MIRRWAHALCAVAAISLAACEGDNVTNVGPEGQGAFTRYAAIGTSISMGVQSGNNAVVYFNQVNAWPALLARQAGVTTFSQPLMRAPGCFPPIVAPIAFARNLRAQPITTTDTTCAGLVQGINPPSATNIFNNLAISGALTTYALNVTPEIAITQGLGASAGDASAVFRRKAYPLVLPPGHTQVTAMMALRPTFVSVELGANEVLGAATTGVVAPGVTFVPPQAWQPEYNKVIDSVDKVVAETGAQVLLVTVPNVSNIIGLRTGAELYADSASFKNRFNVNILSSCAGNQNLHFTPALVPRLVAIARQFGASVLTCNDSASATPASPDYRLTPTDVATLTASIDAMNTHIISIADERGWALLDANTVLAEIKQARPAFSVVGLLTCTLPYGPYISLDGVHPTTAGHVKIANAAVAAVNERYRFTLPPLEEDPPQVAC